LSRWKKKARICGNKNVSCKESAKRAFLLWYQELFPILRILFHDPSSERVLVGLVDEALAEDTAEKKEFARYGFK
jgi:hypothetical protein